MIEVVYEKRSRIEVVPFSELEIRTAEVYLMSMIAQKGKLPMRMQLAPMRMQATLREMALEHLASGAQKKPLPKLNFPELDYW